MENYLWSLIKDLKRPKKFDYKPEQQKEKGDQFLGINNLGNICYMISMLQQFYMVPQFRYSLLKAVDDKPVDM